MDAELRQQIRQRAQDICEYCGMPQQFDPTPFHVDHIIAVKHAGPTHKDNLALACFACNNHKQSDISGIDPDGESDVLIRLFHPRRDDWSEHFIWNGAELVGQTPIGRVTIYVLAINAPHRVNLRQSLINEGVFP